MIDVVVPVYNQLALVAQCIDALAAQKGVGRIVMVDDGSGSEIVEYAKHCPEQVRCIRMETNVGFVDAINTGMEAVSTEYAVIVNSDTVPVRADSLYALVMATHDAKALVGGPKLLFMGGSRYGVKGTIQHAGVGFNPDGVPYHPFMHLHRHTRAANIMRRVHAVTGAVMAVRLDVWRSLRGFDSEFAPGVYEDVDYCLRANSVYYFPHSEWYHLMHGSQSAGHNLFNNESEHLSRLVRKWNPKCDEELFYGV
jgi:GT2 family glycosyltransferase